MTRIKNTAHVAWADYCWLCDRSRLDEAAAILGFMVMGAVAVWLLSVLMNLAGCGTAFLGLPMLLISRRAWTRRTRWEVAQ